MADTSVATEPVSLKGRQYRAVKEGLAQILTPYREPDKSSTASAKPSSKKAHNNAEGVQAVFYNPIQQYNRDLSVLAILTYGEGAIVEKGVRREKREKERKDRKKPNGNAGHELSEKKRKFDAVDDLDNTGEIAKRFKDSDTADEDDLLEVRPLGQNPPISNVEHIVDDAVLPEKSDKASETPSVKQETKPIPFTILDALSASGLRAIRYAKEIPFATNIIANDLLPEAVKSIELNIDHNGLRGKVHSNVGDARAYMYSKASQDHGKNVTGHIDKFDVIDLDPYGTAAPFIDSALQALTDGGLLCVTCTDAGVFASNGYPEKAYSLYGGVTMKGVFSHEAGLRLILHALATSAARYSIAIEPLLSLSIDFYARLFIRVHKMQKEVKLLAGTTMITYSCDFGCGAWKTQLIARNQEKKDRVGDTFYKHSYAQGPSTAPSCVHCGNKMHLGGPMWAGPLHNPYFIQAILDRIPGLDKAIYQTTERIKGMLTVALEEDLTLSTSNSSSQSTEEQLEVQNVATSADRRVIPRLPPQTVDTTPFFFIPNNVAKVLHCTTPPEDQLRGALRHLGYRVSRSHCKGGSFKTNAPWEVIWEVMREWIRQESPVKEGKVTSGMPGWKILQKMRGTSQKSLMEVQEKMMVALERGINSREDLKSLLESSLYRIDHPKIEGAETEKDSDNSKGKQENSIESAWNSDQDVSNLQIKFDANLGREKPRGKLVRYQINPRAHWGPMNKAVGA